MSRINNLNSLIAQRFLSVQNKALSKSLERLSTGLAINRGADNPAGLIASEKLRSNIAKVEGAISNAERAEQVINIAEGGKRDVVLQSEAAMTDQVNRAKGEAEAILAVAGATAEGIRLVAASIQDSGGEKAVSLRLAEQYIDAFGKLAKETNTILLPENTGDIGSMVAQALAVFNKIQNQTSPKK